MPVKAKRTRKSSIRGPKHFYEPLGVQLTIIGATESSVFGKCFIVAAEPHERTFRADGFRFEFAEERNALWDTLHKKELKRLAAKLKAQKAADQRARDDAYDSVAEENAGDERGKLDVSWDGDLSREDDPQDFGVAPLDTNQEDLEESPDNSEIVESQIIGSEFAA